MKAQVKPSDKAAWKKARDEIKKRGKQADLQRCAIKRGALVQRPPIAV